MPFSFASPTRQFSEYAIADRSDKLPLHLKIWDSDDKFRVTIGKEKYGTIKTLGAHLIIQ
jgi:hypothetical protein